MAPVLQRVYAGLPIFAQNMAVTLQGWSLRKARFGDEFERLLKEIEGDAKLPADQLRALQLERLKAIIGHAYEHSAFYRAKYDAAGVKPDQIVSLKDIEAFPVLEKNELRQHAKQIQAQNTIGQPGLRSTSTSGTTGTPIKVAFTAADRRHRHAYLWRI